MKRETAEQIVDDLMTMGGTDEKADRLVLMRDDPKHELGGWCRSALIARILAWANED